MRIASQPLLLSALVVTGVASAVLIFNNSAYKRQLERLDSDNARPAEQLDQSRKATAAAIELFAWDIEAMRKKGMADPASQILADLKQHRELIPYKGVLGGTMGFYDDSKIWILTSKWVLAYFEDGHVAGYLLLEYQVAQGGKITWKTVASYLA